MHAKSVSAWVLALGLLAVVLAASPQDEEHEPATPEDRLEHEMEAIEGALKALRRSMRDPANRADSLDRVAEMQAATVVCKSLAPPMAETVPAGERKAFLVEYRLQLVDFLERLLELERALLSDDAEAAKVAFKQIREMEDSGHERFTEDE